MKMEGTITETQHLVLFWVFAASFLVIGIIAILAILGVVETDKRFHNWAIGGAPPPSSAW